MILIAHRGLIDWPNKNLENNPEEILKTLSYGIDCEIDLWKIENQFYLGHDEPIYKIDKKFLNKNGLWIHAKSLETLLWLTTTKLEYFWHQNDDCVLTSGNYIWTYPEKQLTTRSIRLMPEWEDPNLKTIKDHVVHGICSDYINKIKIIYAL